MVPQFRGVRASSCRRPCHRPAADARGDTIRRRILSVRRPGDSAAPSPRNLVPVAAIQLATEGGSMPALPVAEAIGVTKSYRLGANRVPAVRHVSIAVNAGELVALAGPSGSGKSTLLHLIGCLDRP